ncbi:hypothetical protein ACH5RR_032360 [Cinchona calisaya]|uniref:Uncharacterized protein n=1 Tax=Cinchona calisaya TaxID=153742 RepID=A0ABD2YIZ0_9GENT
MLKQPSIIVEPSNFLNNNGSPKKMINLCFLVNPSLPNTNPCNPIPSRDREVTSGLGILEKQATPSYKQIQDDSAKEIEDHSDIELILDFSPSVSALGTKIGRYLVINDAIVSQSVMVCSSNLGPVAQEIGFSLAMISILDKNVQGSIPFVDIEVISNSILTKLHY